MKQENVDVLVVGGSLVGLASALFLSWQGVSTVVVERHRGSSPHPRAVGFTPRTLELLRGVGLADQVPQAPADFRLRRVKVESLAGAWFEESDWNPRKAGEVLPQSSPCTGAAIAQDGLEPILEKRATELGADVRRATELVSFSQDATHVTARLRSRDGDEYEIRARYMIGADGGKSAIRSALGIGVSGRGHMRTIRSVLFRAPLEEYLARGVSQFQIDQPDFRAFLTTYGDGRWVLMFTDDLERDEAHLRTAITRAIGRTDLPIEILATGRWELGAIVADRFSEGRVFLAGDAAHCFPPTRGGYGANTGFFDAHNLAWKLAAVIAGTSNPALLDTYDAERRPAAWVRHQQLFARPDYARESNGVAANEPIRDDIAMELGELYRSTAVIGAGPELPPVARPDEWRGQPGTRAPHLWIELDGVSISTLDLFGRGFTVVTSDARWTTSKWRTVVVSADVARAFGIGESGASLVRPDGYVAWRATELASDPEHAIDEAIIRIAAQS